jgi:hypothetical protein
VGDRDLGTAIVVRMDASLLISNNDKEQAVGRLSTWGHHPLTAWCDNTGESLAFRLRPENAGSNTAADHIAVLGEALAQIPARQHVEIDVEVVVDQPVPGPARWAGHAGESGADDGCQP